MIRVTTSLISRGRLRRHFVGVITGVVRQWDATDNLDKFDPVAVRHAGRRIFFQHDAEVEIYLPRFLRDFCLISSTMTTSMRVMNQTHARDLRSNMTYTFSRLQDKNFAREDYAYHYRLKTDNTVVPR